MCAMIFIQTWFQQGFLHPLLTPSHLILLISLGVIIGQQGIKLSYFIAISVSLAIGLFFKASLVIDVNIELILLGLALIISLLVVIKLRLPSLLTVLLIILGCFVVAYDSDPIVIPGVGENSINNWLLGALTSMLGVLALISLISLFLMRFWEGVILRIMGSWIATSAIFILTLSLTTLTKGLS